jgi:hypothetical protein
MVPSSWASVRADWYALEGVNNPKTRGSDRLKKGQEIVEKLRRYFLFRAFPREQKVARYHALQVTTLIG